MLCLVELAEGLWPEPALSRLLFRLEHDEYCFGTPRSRELLVPALQKLPTGYISF